MDEQGRYFSVSPNGGSRERLSWPSPSGPASGVAWSRDGHRAAAIYWDAAKGGPSTLVIVNRAGERLRTIRLPGNSSGPRWSPDGTRIAFSTGLTGGRADVWVVDSDGRLHDLTEGRSGANTLASWSPDGNRLLISRASSQTAAHSLWTIDPSGGSLTKVRIPLEHLDAANADWSPDGRTIVFAEWSDLPDFEGIYTVGIDGKRLRRLTNGYDDSPAWSPDAAHIAFERSTDPTVDVWVMDRSGTHERQLTKALGNSSFDLGNSLEGWRCLPN